MPDRAIKARRITAIGTLVVAALLLGGGLYLARVSAQLSYLKSRNFRIAATMAEVAENRLNNVRSVLDSQAKPCLRKLAEQADHGESGRPQECPEAFDSLGGLPCFEHLGWHLDNGANGRDGAAGPSEDDEHEHDHDHGQDPEHEHTHLPRGITEVEVDHGTGKLQVYHRAETGSGEESMGELHGSVDVQCLLTLVEREEVFDDVVVLDSEHRSVFQTGGSGARIHELSVDSPGARERQATGDSGEQVLALPSTISRLQEVEVAGERYAFFRQPVRLELRRRNGEDRAVWEVVGLVRSGRLLSDAMRIDPAGLVVLVSLLLLAVCAWPLFKLSATGRRERIPPREVLWVSASLAVAGALLAVATVDVGLNAQRRVEVEEELAATAQEIRAALTGEIEAARAQLESVRDGREGEGSGADSRDGADDSDGGGAKWHECGGGWGCPDGAHIGGLFGAFGAGNDEKGGDDSQVLSWDEYPYLQMIFWADACGNQVAKRAVGPEPTPLISVEGREYFRRARDGDLWGSTGRGGSSRNGFFVEPIRSWTTGVQAVVLSVPSEEDADQETDGGGAAESRECAPRGGSQADDGGDLGPPVAVMSVIGLPSMLRPVLPPGRGFAVLDREGRVVFHSHPERNGLESFVRETEGSPELRGALFARTDGHFAARYRGRKHQMYGTPLSGLPWHLVVFEDREVLQTMNFEAAMAALLLAIVQLLLLTAALAFIRLVGRRGTLRSLWPAPDDIGSYGRMAAVSLAVAGAFAASFAWAPSARLLLAAGFLLPLTALGLIAAVASPPGRGRAGQRRAALLVAAAAGGSLLAVEAFAAATAAGKEGFLPVLGSALDDPLVPVHAVLLGAAFVVTRRFAAEGRFVRRAGLAVPGRWIGPGALFVGVSGLTLTVLSALPATAFLHGAFQERMDLEARRGQVHLARALLDRGGEVAKRHGFLPPLSVDSADEDAEGGQGESTGSKPGTRLGCDPENETCREPIPWILAGGRDVHAREYLGTCYAYCLDGSPEPERSGDGLPEGAKARCDRMDDLACAPREDPPASPSAWTLEILPFPNRHAVEARAVAFRGSPVEGGSTEPAAAPARGSLTWSRHEDGEALTLHADSVVDDRSVLVSSRVPTPGLPGSPSRELAVLLAMAAASLALVVAALLFVGRRVFHVDFRVRRPPTLADLAGQWLSRLLVIVPPGTAIGDAFGDAELRVDLAQTGTPGGDRDLERLEQELPSAGLVRIDHLEGVLDDAPSRAKGLAPFERLVARSDDGLRLILFAHRDPRVVLAEERARLEAAEDERAARQVLERWEDLLERFPERWVSDAGDRDAFDREIEEERPELGAGLRRDSGGAGWSRRQLDTVQQECRWSRPLQEIGRRLLRRPELATEESDDLMDRICQEAADHYRALWKALAEDERHVLAQIACGCLVNRGLERPLDHLLKWGLLVREPSTFRVMNESFRRFVVARHDPAALLRWEAEGSVSFWRQVRVPFFAVLIAAGLFLLVTQRHLFNLAIAVASAGAAALPGLVKLVGWVRTARKAGEG